MLNIVSIAMILGALLAVVVGQAFLANGQVRLSALQQQLNLEKSSNRQAELSVSELETPSRIVAAASGQLHMVHPSQVIELPYVSLTTPLPTPKLTAAPPAPPPAPAPVTTGTTASGGAASASGGTSTTSGGTSTTSGGTSTTSGGTSTSGGTAPTTTPTSTP